MNKSTRNTLRNTVTTCRRLLEESIAERLQGQFGLHADGRIEDTAGLTHLSPEEQRFRAQLVVHLEHIEAGGLRRKAGKNKKRAPSPQPQVSKETVAQLVREIAFTHLNRLAAYKLMETRGLIRESVSRGVKSQGFLFYLAQHPEDEALWRGGQQELAYAHFLAWLGGTLSREIGVLFAPTDPANRLLPPQRVLDELLALLNSDDLAGIWDQDETIGWVYQYFTPKELRDQARKESQAPRNSYELSFRNQFYTPRYVVQFLTDNTLGRIWYEMRQGDTALAEQCAYLVRRPNEVFLEAGEFTNERIYETTNDSIENPKSKIENPVYIPFRAKRDPRTLKILDPACGSGHFLLYAFDLLTTIYAEAYDDPDLGPALQADFPDPAAYRRAVPGLILRHNLHGIDIDPRAIQIASLALWLKAKKTAGAPGSMGAGGSALIPNSQSLTPVITKMNLVTAEPMPGSAALLREFTATLNPPVLGQLVEAVFDKMKLAGEAGALLKIEEELGEAIEAAKQQWLAGPQPEQLAMWPDAAPPPTAEQLNMFDLTGISDAQFWDEAEGRVLTALQSYAEQAEADDGGRLARRLFADDAARGFAFIDLCRQRFDVVLMNPPFGEFSLGTRDFANDQYPICSRELYAAFVQRNAKILAKQGFLGAITSRTGFFLTSLQSWRSDAVLPLGISVVADLGDGVLDTAMVETAAYILGPKHHKTQGSTFIRLSAKDKDRENSLLQYIEFVRRGKKTSTVYHLNSDKFKNIFKSPFAYWVTPALLDAFKKYKRLEGNAATVKVGLQTGDDFRFLRVFWEVPPKNIVTTGKPPFDWVPHAKGGENLPFYADIHLLVKWVNNGEEIKQYPSSRPQNSDYYFAKGLTFPYRTYRFSPAILPSGCITGVTGMGIFPVNLPLYCLLALLNSGVVNDFISVWLGVLDMDVLYQAGNIQPVPVPTIPDDIQLKLAKLAKRQVEIKVALESHKEETRYFSHFKTNELSSINSIAESRNNFQKKVKEESLNLFRLSEDEVALLYQLQHDEEAVILHEAEATFAKAIAISEIVPEQIAAELFSYAIGCIVGFWDIRLAIDSTLAAKLPDPTDLLPVCPPGALAGPDGLPATPDTIVSEAWLRARPSAITLPPAGSVAQPTIPDSAYPLRLDWDGILVDDPDHQDDIVRRVRDVLELLWGEESREYGVGSMGTNDEGQMTKDKGQVTPDDIEREACEILGVKALRDYFRKSGKGGFWDDHVKRYSKSRRKAPIYWLLQSSKKNYALWLYYHRLDGDLLYKALVNYVEPKIRLEENRLEGLRQRLGSEGSALPARERRALEKSLADQEDFVAELRDFEDKLRRAANLNLTPDLNDGVVLNIAPLWELAPWKEARKYWERLLDGQYEWSSIGAQLRERGMVK